MLDRAHTPLPIDTPDDPPPLTEWSPAPSRVITALLGCLAVTALAMAILLVAGTRPFAAFLAAAVLAILIGIVWLVWWPSDGRLAQLLRWWL